MAEKKTTSETSEQAGGPSWVVPPFMTVEEVDELEKQLARKRIDFHGVSVEVDPAATQDYRKIQGDGEADTPLAALLPTLVPDEDEREQLLEMCFDGERTNFMYVTRMVQKLIEASSGK